MRISKKIAAVAVGTAVAVAGASVAYAYWSESGTGTGSATAGTTSGITINQTSVPGAALYPGGPVENLSGNFTSTNTGSVLIAGVTATVTGITGGGTAATPACTPADFVIGGSTTPYTVAPGTVTTWSGLNISLKNTATNQDNCKTATAVITYAAVGATS